MIALLRASSGKDKWFDRKACDGAPRRTFVSQCVSNHRDPRPFLPAGKWQDEAFTCPYCSTPVDTALEQAEADEWAAASEEQRKEITLADL